MSEAFAEALESEGYELSGEAYEAEGAGEAGYEGEAAGEAYEGEGAGEAGYEGYGEDASSDARRRARQRQIMIARQRQAQTRRRPAGAAAPRRAVAAGPAPTLRAIRADVRARDLDTQAALIRLRRAVDQSTRMAYRNAWVAELSTGASQAIDSFGGAGGPLANHDWARALIRGVPDLLLAPGNPGNKQGLERIAFDPRFGGSVLIAALWAWGHFTGSSDGAAVAKVQFSGGPLSLTTSGAGRTAQIGANALDRNGNQVPSATIAWQSQNPAVASVNPASGPSTTVKGEAPGSTWIGATAGGKTEWVAVSVG
jgi:hypothetical protein